MTRQRMKRKTSPIHRITLTHGQGGVPKFIREDTEQFFAAVTARRKSKMTSASKPIIANEAQQRYQSKSFITNEIQQQNKPKPKINDEKKNENIPIPKPSTPVIALPPIRTVSSQRSKSASSAAACIHQPTLPLVTSSLSSSLETSTPFLESPEPLSRPKHQLRRRRVGPVDQDIFRNAYERALSVARSRLLFRDPYSLTRASATHGILYSYYDHTPMCIFSRGTDCNHHQDKTIKSEEKSKGNVLRRQIFNDVNVEHYIQ